MGLDIFPVSNKPDYLYCQSGQNVWSFLDGGYCISLRERNDRYLEALKEVHRTGLCQMPLFQFYRPERSKDGFVAGCWSSHQNVAKLALEKSQNVVLVLEDDFQLDEA